jgi:AP-1 complex subunit gamma-1
MTTKISLAAERFAPNQRWHIDTMLRMLKLAGGFVREEVLAGFIRLVAQTSDLHQYTVQKLYAALKQDISQVQSICKRNNDRLTFYAYLGRFGIGQCLGHW